MSATKPVGTELYEQVGLQDSQHHYMMTNRPQQLQVATSPPPSIDKTAIKLNKGSLIALIITFFVCAVIVSLVAVVMYSPLVQGSTGAAQESALLARIQQLEGTISTVHNSMQTVSSIQNTMSQNLDHLLTANLYQSCFEQTRTCSISTSSTSSYTGCSTSGIDINPRVSITCIQCTLYRP